MEPLHEIYECEKCGAPLDLTPETIIAICSYCGFPNTISGLISPDEATVVPSLPENTLVKGFWSLVRRDRDLRKLRGINLMDIEGHYMPVWAGRVRIYGTVSYYERRVETRGKTTRTKTVYYIDKVDREEIIVVPARRQFTGFGAKELMLHYAQTRPKETILSSIESSTWENIRLRVLGAEYDKKTAMKLIVDEAVDNLREEYLKKGDGIDCFDIHVTGPFNVRLVLLPVWNITYTYAGSAYQAVFAGWDNQCVIRTEPLTASQRALSIVGGAFLSFLAAPVAHLLLTMDNEISLGDFVIIFIIGTIAFGLVANAFKGARVER